MALKTYNPTTPSERQLVTVDRSTLHKGAPVKTLTEGKSSSGGGWESVLIIDGAEVEKGFASAARNIPHVDVIPVQGINVYDILRRKTLVLTKAAVDALEARFK